MKKTIFVLAALAVAAVAQAADLKEDAAIKGQFEKLQKAFNAGDAKGVAALFADDADLVTPAGVYAKGRAEIEKAAAGDIEHIIAGGTSTITVNDWRVIGKDLVIVNASHDFKGGKGPMPEGHVILTTVLAKRAGQWFCIAARPMVPVRPPADAPAAAAAPAAAPATATAATPAAPTAAAATPATSVKGAAPATGVKK